MRTDGLAVPVLPLLPFPTVQAVMANGFKTRVGSLVVAGLYGLAFLFGRQHLRRSGELARAAPVGQPTGAT